VWCAFAGQAAFVASWLVAGALQPRYSHLAQGVSTLAASDAAHPWIVTAGIVILGASFVALAVALALVLPRREAVPVALFAGVGVLLCAQAALRMDCGAVDEPRCNDLWRAGRLSWHHGAHIWLSLVVAVLLLLTPLALAYAIGPGTAAAVALSAGGFGLAFFIVSFAGTGLQGEAGFIERIGLGITHLWVFIVGGGMLYATRAGPRVSDLIPMRPREFLAHSWTGDGELVLRPFWLGRFFRQRCEARRESTWISDRVWRIDDEAHFGGGRFERRSMFCEFVADDQVRLTADDLLDGADVWLEEGGWRLSEFRMAWPVGPMPVIVRCTDRSYVAQDGTFVNRIDVHTLGPRIPVARVTFRMRPTVPHRPADARGRTLEAT
jgi:hypothetical protein